MEHHTATETFSPQRRSTGEDMQLQGLAIEDNDVLRELLRQLVRMPGFRQRSIDWECAIDELLTQPINLQSIEPLVRDLHDRLVTQRSAAADRWAYDAARWKLVAPNGRTVQLSLAESQLVRCLFQTQGEVASREDLLTALNRPHLEAYSRNLDVTVSRLRKKVEAQCRQRLPLTSARGRGYVFNAPAEVVG
jgi:DNA-binding response OmpR family regulator